MSLVLLAFMVGLLVVGMAFFAVGRISNLRTDAQTAADAAALAGAAQLRDQFRVEAAGRLADIVCGAGLSVLDGFVPDTRPAASQARAFAASNDATVIGFARNGRRFVAEVSTTAALPAGAGAGTRGRAVATGEVSYRLLLSLPLAICTPPPPPPPTVPPTPPPPPPVLVLPPLEDVLRFQVRLVD